MTIWKLHFFAIFSSKSGNDDLFGDDDPDGGLLIKRS